MNKILVVDDDLAIRMFYSEELSEEGYDVVTCGDGLKLMEQIEREMPDVIVMDIKLCNCSGLDLLQGIRDAQYQMPVILCTDYGTFHNDLKSIAADFYVLKSSDLFELKTKIKLSIDGGTPFFPMPVHEKDPDTKTIFVNKAGLPWEMACREGNFY